jgi:hypothetical protein
MKFDLLDAEAGVVGRTSQACLNPSQAYLNLAFLTANGRQRTRMKTNLPVGSSGRRQFDEIFGFASDHSRLLAFIRGWYLRNEVAMESECPWAGRTF